VTNYCEIVDAEIRQNIRQGRIFAANFRKHKLKANYVVGLTHVRA
jgi:hypothetical protein